MYKDIADYGLIGDMHAVALVSNEGSIDYCAMPHIDSPTVFAAILDDQKGGFFSIRPKEDFESEQKYLKNSNILSCWFRTKTGRAQLVDFMPVNTQAGASTRRGTGSQLGTGTLKGTGTQELPDKECHIIHRCLKVDSGTMDFELQCFPRPQYALELPRIERVDNGFKIMGENDTFTFVLRIEKYEIVEQSDNGFAICFSLREGQSAHFDFICGEAPPDEKAMCGFRETHKFWIDWLHNCVGEKCFLYPAGHGEGEYTDMINRSLLVLKLLTFQPTGAIAAAATTSLPEVIGGERNWDYRFTWLRDASFTLKALFSLGHIDEAESFIKWLHQTYEKYGSRKLRIMYSLEGGDNLDERTLDYLKGYKESGPVRIGNAAYTQHQWDIYGEVMDSALRLSDYAGKIDENLWPFFRDICNLAIQNWQRPDEGIWEVRNGPFSFVYSKVMCWVALDRGIKIAMRYGFDAPTEHWKKERDKIKEDILEKGYDHDLGSFVQYYGSKELDASLLLLPLMNFLPIDDWRIQGTIERCKKYLLKQGFLLRYSTADGLDGEEGAFILCNFWLVECLILSGKLDEAQNILSVTLKASNHLGLFSEEYDFTNKRMLGNFPQAFSHIGLINAVSAILNVRNKAIQGKKRASGSKRKGRHIPFRRILNKSGEKSADTNSQIARRLKIALNNLQGAFFDVGEGRVDYEVMKKSESYRQYVEEAKKLNGFDPFYLDTDKEKKAFWINIYNILIIHGVIELGVNNSVKEVFGFFRRIGYCIGGLYFTPADIEHGILRANRPYTALKFRQFSQFDKRRALRVRKPDSRIHFALVCAATSCPPVEFYDTLHVEGQLDTAGRSFVNRSGVILDKSNNTLSLSRIFKWYFLDFGRTKKEVVNFILRFANEEMRNYVLENGSRIKIRYLPYNWNLNKSLN